MDSKTVIIGAKLSPFERRVVQEYARLRGQTVSQLIRERVIDRAVKPLRQAALQVEVSEDVGA
jgi:hypothetical protein